MESNSVGAEESEAPYYFPCFDIVPFAETKVFEAASDPSTREYNRQILYKLYEKMAGKEEQKEPEISWTDRMVMLRRQALMAAPKTKHFKKQLLWQKVKSQQKLKNTMIKMFLQQ